MNVLYLNNGKRTCTSRIHINFIKKLARLCNLTVFGPLEDEINKGEYTIEGNEISPTKFDAEISSQEIIKELDIDLILLPEWGLVQNTESWEGCPLPVVMVEGDFYCTPKGWYKEKGIDLVVSRAPASKFGVPSVWLPYSANEEEFYTDENSNYVNNRAQEITFIGDGLFPARSLINSYYEIRREAVRTLLKHNLLQLRGNLGSEHYPFMLKKSIAALSCSFPPLYCAPAKTWEIMASGTALLSTHFRMRKELFGEEQVFFEYEADMSNIVEVAKNVLLDLPKTLEVTKNALTIVNKKHLDKHRIVELYNILKAILSGEKIPILWGI